jgi:hypothetical protein
MSISGQQTINIGLPNESTNSDTLYTAFNKTQDNFVQLFNCSSPYTNFVAISGISITTTPSTGTVTFTNTGITDIIAGTNIVVSNVDGVVTISSTGGGGGGGSGTVTSVGLQPVSNSRLVVTNSPIVSSGVIGIDLSNSGATAGTYNNPNVTVDRFGRVTSISNGASSGTVTSIGLTGGQGIQINGGPITSAGSILVTNTGVTKINAGSGISVDSGTGEVTVSLAGYTGTVTNVGLYSTSLTISGSPITTQGTIRVELPANPVFTGNLNVGNANLGNLAKANFFQGDGGLLSNINGSNVTGQVANALVAGTVYTAAQPNITSVGTLTSLTVTGNITGGNLNTGGVVSATGNGTFGNVTTTLVSASAATVTGNGTFGNINVSGTVTASRLISNIATGTAPLTVTSTTLVNNLYAARANVSDYSAVTAGSTGIYYLTFVNGNTSANYALTSNAIFSANIANGAIAATTFLGNIQGGTGNSNVGNLGFGSGQIIGTGNITASNFIGNVIGNISGNITVNGSNTQVLFNDSGNANATAGFTFNKTTNAVSLTGNLTAGNANLGNAVTANYHIGNLYGTANLATYATTANSVAGANVSGTVSSATTAGTVTTNAQPNITSVSTSFTNLIFANAQTVSGNNMTLTTGANTNTGTITGNWTLSTGSKLQATYADLAEYYEGDEIYEYGTVLMFSGAKEVTLATEKTIKVAGVVSKDPAYVMNSNCQGIATLVALQGRVPCKVSGNIEKGDLMISAGNGYAMACNEPRLGQVIGKSLADFQGSTGVIEIAVGRV